MFSALFSGLFQERGSGAMLEKFGELAAKTIQRLAKAVKRVLEFLRKLAEGDLDGARHALLSSSPEDMLEFGLEEEERTPGKGGPKPGSPSPSPPSQGGPPKEAVAEIVVGEEPPFSEVREEQEEMMKEDMKMQEKEKKEHDRHLWTQSMFRDHSFIRPKFAEWGATHKGFIPPHGSFGAVFREGKPVTHTRVGENYWNTRPRVREVGPHGEFPPTFLRFQGQRRLIQDFTRETEDRVARQREQANVFESVMETERERELHQKITDAFAARATMKRAARSARI